MRDHRKIKVCSCGEHMISYASATRHRRLGHKIIKMSKQEAAKLKKMTKRDYIVKYHKIIPPEKGRCKVCGKVIPYNEGYCGWTCLKKDVVRSR